jgi:hypothetical protein
MINFQILETYKTHIKKSSFYELLINPLESQMSRQIIQDLKSEELVRKYVY